MPRGFNPTERRTLLGTTLALRSLALMLCGSKDKGDWASGDPQEVEASLASGVDLLPRCPHCRRDLVGQLQLRVHPSERIQAIGMQR